LQHFNAHVHDLVRSLPSSASSTPSRPAQLRCPS
jgi:hypothetical protein